MPLRVIAEFYKEGVARYISHLDLMRAVQRSMRRAQIPVEYSQGFNPHAVLSFATALPVGCASRCEIMDVRLERDIDLSAFVSKMNAQMPDGLRISRATEAIVDIPPPMAIVQAAAYDIAAPGDHASTVTALRVEKSVVAVKHNKKRGAFEVDIRPMVYELDAEVSDGQTTIHCLLRQDGALALQPALLMTALGICGTVLRTALMVRKGEGWSSLYEIYEKGKA